MLLSVLSGSENASYCLERIKHRRPERKRALPTTGRARAYSTLYDAAARCYRTLLFY